MIGSLRCGGKCDSVDGGYDRSKNEKKMMVKERRGKRNVDGGDKSSEKKKDGIEKEND